MRSVDWIRNVYRIATNTPQTRSREDVNQFNIFNQTVDEYIRRSRQEWRQKEEEKSIQSRKRHEKEMKSKFNELERARKQKEEEDLESEEIRRRRELRSPSKKDAKETIGRGLSDSVTRGSGLDTPCPNNVLADVERLEILTCGKRTGNNSPEIVNEAAAICQR